MSCNSHEEYHTAYGSDPAGEPSRCDNLASQVPGEGTQYYPEITGFDPAGNFFSGGRTERHLPYRDVGMDFQAPACPQYADADTNAFVDETHLGRLFIDPSVLQAPNNDSDFFIAQPTVRFGHHDAGGSEEQHGDIVLEGGDYMFTEDDDANDVGLMSEQNAVGNIDLSHLQYHHSTSTPNNNPYGWEDQMNRTMGRDPPWNPLQVSHQNAWEYRSPPVNNSGSSSQWPRSDMPSQGEISSVSNAGMTWPSYTSNEPNPPMASSGMPTALPPLTSNNLSRMSRRVSQTSNNNSIPANSQSRMGRGTSAVGTRHGNRAVKVEGRKRSYGQHLPVPEYPTGPVSPATSFVSVTPSNVPDVLLCLHGGCPKTFTGTHRRGTLHRHMRLKHKYMQNEVEQEKEYRCEAIGCGKTFKRQDARLKHLRAKHPELGIAAAVPRKQKLL